LRRNGITDDGAKTLVASWFPLNLTWLDLADNPISQAGNRTLRKRFANDMCV